MVGEVGHEELAKLAPYQSDDLLDVVFNFNVGAIASFDIRNVHQQLVAMEDQLCGLPTLFFNSHDMARSMSRLCHDDVTQAAALVALTLTAKGVVFLYFGEEIGMPSFIPENFGDLRDARAVNHFQLALAEGTAPTLAFNKALEQCRDKSRLYMQWNSDKFSGFSTSVPWIGGEASKNLPKAEEQINDPDSLWHWYKELITLRRNNQALNFGGYDILSLDKMLLYFSRRWQDQTVRIQINFNAVKQPINYDDSHEILACRGLNLREPDYLPPFGILITRVQRDVC